MDNKPCLTEEIAIKAIREFFRNKPFIVFGTGMSCALDERFGMNALQKALIEEIQKLALTGTKKTEWDAVISALNNGTDLENALNSVSDQDLLKQLTRITGDFIAEIDKTYAYRIANGESQWPATMILKKLVDTLPEGDPILHVLTPNYDMLFEYACDAAGIPYTNGLFGGVERRKDWQAVDRALKEAKQICQNRKMKIIYKHKKHVRLYKVHGSLNYFFHRNIVIENDAWMWNPPDYAERVMITPGLSKYQTLQRYRQELLQTADAEINKASLFLFLGYGFNDVHLEEYIKRKLIAQQCHGLIITKDSNARIESLLQQSDNLWIVCKMQEQNANGSRVYNKQYSDWLMLPDKKLWNIGEFTRQILGG
ncbi:MAG TPA: hypothetical protein DDZ37_04090 [Spirochaetaceae bacterium]|nr:hypothetical protein [Spirochaetaceae bacterium]